MLAATPVHTLRRVLRVTVAHALRLDAELAVDVDVAEMVHLVLQLRELDELTAAGGLAVVKRGEDGERAGGSGRGVHVRGRRRVDELVVVVPGEVAEAGEPVELRTESRVRRPVAGESRRGDAQDEQARIAFEELALVDPDLVQRGRLEVLDEHVGLLHETHEQLARLGTARVQRAGELVAGDGVVHRVPVVGPVGVSGRGRGVHGQQRAEHHAGVGPRQVALRRGREDRRVLDPNHLGAEIGEELGEVRPGPHGGEVEYPHAVQRRYVGIGLTARRYRSVDAQFRVDVGVVLTDARRGALHPPATLRVPVRRPGDRDRARVRVLDVHPEAALMEMVRNECLLRRVHPGQRPSRRLRELGQLGARV